MTLHQEFELLSDRIRQAEMDIAQYSIRLYKSKVRSHKADLKAWIKREIEWIIKWEERKTVVRDEIFNTTFCG